VTTRSSVDKNTVLVSGLPVKTKAKPTVTLSSDKTNPSQSGALHLINIENIFFGLFTIGCLRRQTSFGKRTYRAGALGG